MRAAGELPSMDLSSTSGVPPKRCTIRCLMCSGIAGNFASRYCMLASFTAVSESCSAFVTTPSKSSARRPASSPLFAAARIPSPELRTAFDTSSSAPYQEPVE